jgi:ATP-binding cassette subfamily B protein
VSQPDDTQLGAPEVTSVVTPLVWPAERLGDALTALAFHGGLSRHSVENPTRIEPLGDALALDRWLAAAGQRIGVEVQSVAVRYWEVDTFLNSGDTALLQHADGFVAAVGARGKRLILLGPDGTTASVRKHDVRRALRPAWELAMRQGIEGRLERVAIPPRRR